MTTTLKRPHDDTVQINLVDCAELLGYRIVNGDNARVAAYVLMCALPELKERGPFIEDVIEAFRELHDHDPDLFAEEMALLRMLDALTAEEEHENDSVNHQ